MAGDSSTEVKYARSTSTSAFARKYRVIGWFFNQSTGNILYILATIICSCAAITMPILSLDHTRFRIFVPTAVYILLIISYSLLYYWRYLNDRTSFTFAGGLSRHQLRRMRSKLGHDIESAEAVTAILCEVCSLVDFPNSIDEMPGGDFRISAPLGHTITTTKIYVSAHGAAPASTITVHSRDQAVKKQFGFAGESITRSELQNCHKHCLKWEQTALAVLRERAESLSSDNPDVWNYADFFYFSVITQATVGYGDILPNSSRIRMLVTSQVLLGYLVVGTFFAMVFAQR